MKYASTTESFFCPHRRRMMMPYSHVAADRVSKSPLPLPRLAVAMLMVLAASPTQDVVASSVAAKWTDYSLSADVRAEDLLPRLTLAQKGCLMSQNCAGFDLIDGSGKIPTLSNTECLHGATKVFVKPNWPNNGSINPGDNFASTVYPSPISQAATFDTELVQTIANAVADDLRAGYNAGLDWPYCFSPDVNLVRDPRYGRGQETWGESPWLVSAYAKALVNGYQNTRSGETSENLPSQPEMAATCKHLVGYDHAQGYTNVEIDDKNLWESYMPAFESCIESKTRTIMCSYGLVNNIPTCASPNLLNGQMRGRLNFEGLIVTDCGAIENICRGNWVGHKNASDCSFGPNNTRTGKCSAGCLAAAAAAAIASGVDLICGQPTDDASKTVPDAVSLGYLSEAQVNRAVLRGLKMRIELGMFEPPSKTRWSSLDFNSTITSKAHAALALRAAQEGIVLLKNEGDVLPLVHSSRLKVALVGPLANDSDASLGEKGYQGTLFPSLQEHVTVLAALKSFTANKISFAPGCQSPCANLSVPLDIKAVVSAASSADVTIAVVGHTTYFETEGRDRTGVDEYSLPAPQLEMLKAIRSSAPNTKLIVVMVNGMAIGTPWMKDNVPAIVEALRSGQAAGTAIVDILFGKVNPSGRLPYTVVESLAQLPDFDDMAITKGRGHRYYGTDGAAPCCNTSAPKPLWYFGDGLSYTQFKYSELSVNTSTIAVCDSVEVSVTLTNVGKIPGSEVTQLYLAVPDENHRGIQRPRWELVGISRSANVAPGEQRSLSFTLVPSVMSIVYEDGFRYIEAPGRVQLWVGGSTPEGLAQSTIETTAVSVSGTAPVPLRLC